jgi:hypothetical protein
MLIAELSPETRTIADRLNATEVGGIVSFAEMSAAIGRNILSRRHVIYSAMRLAEKESGAIFATIRGQGYKRLAASEVVEIVGSSARAHIRRTARRSAKTLNEGTRRHNNLPPEMQRKVASEMSVLGLIEHISRDKVVAPKEDAPTKPQPVAVTAREFLKALVAE